MPDVARMSFQERLGETISRTLPKVGPDVAAQLRTLIEPASLATMAVVLAAWAVSHAFGVGEAIDIILGVVGVLSVGVAIFSGLDHLTRFALGAYNGRTERDLDTAAEHLAQAIAIIGITAVLAFLFRGRPIANRRPVPTRMPTNGGWRYRPSTTVEPLPRGTLGATDMFGNVRINALATASQQAVARLHEAVHVFLTPKMYFLRRFRISNREGSYFNSSLWRYFEEALAQTIGRVGVEGFSQAFSGIGFPVQNGYVFLVRRGGFNAAMAGKGVFVEGAGLVATGLVQGLAFELWFKQGYHPPAPERDPLTPMPSHRGPDATRPVPSHRVPGDLRPVPSH